MHVIARHAIIQQPDRKLFQDDAGATWVRITDDQHQFGWIGRVTGDPRIYGRVYVGTGGRGIVYGDAAEFDTAAPPAAQGSY